MLVLAKASCGSSSCHGFFVDPETGDLLVVGNRTGVVGAEPRAVVEVRRDVYEEATNALGHAARSVGIDSDGGDPLAVEIVGDVAFVAGRPVPIPPSTIGVAPHESLVLVRRIDQAFARALVEALA